MNSKRRKGVKQRGALLRVFVATLGCLVMTTMVDAQGLEQGQVEVTGHAGFVTGIGTHGIFGASAGRAIRDRIFAFGEFSYIPIAGATVSLPGLSTSLDRKGYLFGGGGHYQFRRSRSVVPYVGAGVSILHRTESVSATIGGTSSSSDRGATDGYFQFGGGGRYYVNDHWGFRPELMIFVGSESFMRLSGGIFYQFGK